MNHDSIGIKSGRFKVVGMQTVFHSCSEHGKLMEDQEIIGNPQDLIYSLKSPTTHTMMMAIHGASGVRKDCAD